MYNNYECIHSSKYLWRKTPSFIKWEFHLLGPESTLIIFLLIWYFKPEYKILCGWVYNVKQIYTAHWKLSRQAFKPREFAILVNTSPLSNQHEVEPETIYSPVGIVKVTKQGFVTENLTIWWYKHANVLCEVKYVLNISAVELWRIKQIY